MKLTLKITTYPRKGTVTPSSFKIGVVIFITTHPRKGTET